jgi:uncharacterized membrane protein
MTSIIPYVAALLIGVIAGLRMWTAPAAVSWAAWFGAIQLDDSWLTFLGTPIAHWLLSGLVLVETIFDQWPGVPSRKTPIELAGRIVSGALCGAAVTATSASWEVGMAAGIAGALGGTFGGYTVRMKLARAFRRDRPAGVLEDAVALTGAALIVAFLA